MFGSLLIATETQGQDKLLLLYNIATFLSAFVCKYLKKRSALSFSGKN
jgi:hypothetical protein